MKYQLGRPGDSRAVALACLIGSFLLLSGCAASGDDCGCDDGGICVSGTCVTLCNDDRQCGAKEACNGDICVATVCGDGRQEGREQCDQAGNNADGADCTLSCTLNVCGDGRRHLSKEECDDNNLVATDQCTNECTIARCGDGVIQQGVEECDDENVTAADGCSSTCQTESGFCCIGDCVVDGAAHPTDSCLVCDAAVNTDAWSPAPGTDGDGDGVRDSCDQCPGGDDRVDSDGDTTPDACDRCPGLVDTPDSPDGDDDYVPDVCDRCPGGDDLVDVDADGIPDACQAALVADIGTATNESSRALPLIDFGGVHVFVADDGLLGRQLWRTDGSATGTRLLALIDGEVEQQVVVATTAVGERLFVSARAGEGGNRVWAVRDGSAVAVTDHLSGRVTLGGAVSVSGGGIVFLVADRDWQVWFSNGTKAGTIPLTTKTVLSGSFGSTFFVGMGDKALFTVPPAADNARRELWVTDGSVVGTKSIVVNAAGNQSLSGAVSDGTTIYFLTRDDTTTHLWSAETDGSGDVGVRQLTSAAQSVDQVVNIIGGADTSGNGQFDLLYFSANFTAATTRSTWSFTAADGQVTRVSDADAVNSSGGAQFDGRYFFGARPAGGQSNLWSSDGATAAQFADLNPGRSSFPRDLVAHGGALYFSASAESLGSRLWSLAGAAASPVADTSDAETAKAPRGLHSSGGELYFQASDTAQGAELFHLTADGPGVLVDLNTQTSSSRPTDFQAFANRVCFRASDALWCKSPDGAPTVVTFGTGAVRVITAPAQNSQGLYVASGAQLLRVDDTAFAASAVANVGAWGTIEHIRPYGDGLLVLAKRVRTRPGGGFPGLPRRYNEYSLHYFDGATLGPAPLWVGRSREFLIFVPQRFRISGYLKTLEVSGRVYLYVGDLFFGRVLVVDKVPANTLTLSSGVGIDRDAALGPLQVGNRVLFTSGSALQTVVVAGVGAPQTEGAQVLADLNPEGPENLTGFVGLGGMMYFAATTVDGRRELWRTDGVNAPERVTSIRTDGPAAPEHLVVLNDELCFSADSGVGRRELYCGSGAEPSGYRRIDGPNPAGGSNPTELLVAGNTLFFSAYEPGVGRELFRTNARGGGIRLQQNILAGRGGSKPTNLAYVAGELWFSARDNLHGFEPWSLPALALP